MASNHIQPGKVLDYVNDTSADVVSGQVVLAGVLLGVALGNIPKGSQGSVALEGVFAVPKEAGASIGQGAAVVFKASSQAFTVGEAAAGDVSGPCAAAFKAAAADDELVHIKFTGVPGTVAA